MSRIKIMHVAQAGGGVDRYLRSLLKYIDKQKFENILVCSYDYNGKDYFDLVDVFEQVDMCREISPKVDIKSVIKIRKLIKKYRPDIVYVHSSKAGVLGRIANFGLKNSCVYNAHGWSFNMDCSEGKKIFYATIEKFCSHFCDKIICISHEEQKSALARRICSQSKLKVIPNGIDIARYDNNSGVCFKRSDFGIPNNAFVIGMVGRITKQKSPDVFMKAAKEIKSTISEAYFILVGDGEMRSEIEQYAKENNLSDSLMITGWVENPMDYIKLFDVATLLSRWEGFGLVLPEYMIAKKPIVATKVDAIPDIIKNGFNGLLVEKENYKMVYKSVIKLHEDRELSNRLVSNANDDVRKRFNVQRVASEHEKLFKSLV